MSPEGRQKARDKMTRAGVHASAIEVFSHYYDELEAGRTGLIPEDTIEPLADPDRLADAEVDEAAAREAFAQTAIIKLNGGLGTSMGMAKAKSLLPVRDGRTFLDLIVAQVLAARAEHGVRLPLVLMNSFRTRDDSLEALGAYADLAVDGLPLDFLQNQEPKLRTDTLEPVEWPADPSLEWCPPGHGDIYTALWGSGLLDQLIEAGFRYASVSNSDNLGAAPDARIAGWFASTGAPYAAEVCTRTAADRKGGHLAVRRSDGRLILRDTAQTPDEEMDFFTDEHRHPFFHTNNLWFDLEQVRAVLAERNAVLGLPLIRNTKTVDPGDSSSPEVFQIETAMGAAIEVFEGATAITVGRERFLPVKTTNDLLVLRSDAYDVDEAGRLALHGREKAPLVSLDSKHYKKIGDFDARFPHGAPSLVGADSLGVEGEWTFGRDVTVTGAVTLATDDPQTVADGTHLS
ncbi:UTP--glucose-1-phosphate uridylyltransferase [Mariniluteicoccus flavus]